MVGFGSGSGIRDPGPGSGMVRNQDPESGINIPDPQHCKNPCFVCNVNLLMISGCYSSFALLYVQRTFV
jgi:hypothetical protein